MFDFCDYGGCEASDIGYFCFFSFVLILAFTEKIIEKIKIKRNKNEKNN